MGRALAEDAARRELVATVRRIYARGWCDGTSGNYSTVLSRDPLRLLITSSGVDKGSIEPEHLLVLGADNRPVERSAGRPSAESLLHLEVVRRTEAAAVLHTHSVWGTLLGEHHLAAGGFEIRGYEMLKGFDGVRDHRAAVRVPVVDNSQDMERLAAEIPAAPGRRGAAPGFLIAGHGLYTWGSGLDEAYRHVEIFEFLFQVVARKLGWPAS